MVRSHIAWSCAIALRFRRTISLHTLAICVSYLESGCQSGREELQTHFSVCRLQLTRGSAPDAVR